MADKSTVRWLRDVMNECYHSSCLEIWLDANMFTF